jgi:hypothetical protein
MTIPASQIVQVNPGVLAAAGSAIDLNGLILTDSTSVPIGSVQPFASADDVGAFFGLTSLEYEAALIYFKGPDAATKTPGVLLFSQYPTDDVAAYLRSASLADVTLAQLKLLSGTLTVTSNGAPLTSSSISLSAATSFSNAATLIQAGFTSPTFAVSYDPQLSAFVFTSSTTGEASTIGFASGPLSSGLRLTSATGAVTSQGEDEATPGEAMSAIAALTQNWAAFTTTWEPDLAGKVAFSAWTSAQDNRYAYAGYDSDPNAKISGNTSTWMAAVNLASGSGTLAIFGDLTHAAFALSWVASADVDRLNGRTTLAFQKQAGILPSVDNASDANALIANGYNFYGAYATANDDFTFMYPGSISGQYKWADSYVGQIWLNAQLQLAMFTLLQSVGSNPYNASGYALIDAAVLDPINAAINFGAIRTGVALSASQAADIRNALGVDVSQAITANGYYLQIVPATAAIRVERSSPPMTLYYTDGGSIQKLTLASIEVQ